MADEPLPQQLVTLRKLLDDVDARLSRAPVAPAGLEDLKRSVDTLRTNMWAVLSAGHGAYAAVRVERLKLRRAIEGIKAVRAALSVPFAQSQQPAGLAAAVLADPSFTWIRREAPGFRVYFLEGSYPAAHQDSLLAGLPPALGHARSLIDAPALGGPIDLFYIESRPQMTAMIGGRATGFAQPSTRTVLLVTNPEWRGFERHEIMHVVAQRAWGSPAPGTDWLQEGLAQAA